MKIKSVTINNFRSIQHATIEFRDYSIIVGENNVGKSNIIDAIRCFYGDVELTVSDIGFNSSTISDPWIEIEYDMTPVEYIALPEIYRINKNKLRVRKEINFSELERNIDNGFKTRYVCPGAIETNKDIEKFLGKILYIPAILDKKTLNKSIVDSISVLMCKKIEQKAEVILSDLDNKIIRPHLETINQALNDEIKWLGIQSKLDVIPISVKELLKSKLMLHIIETYVPENVDALGTGMQRIIVSNIIKMNSESNNKDATILLFEEPEANMHPEAIADMSYNLREFAKKDNQQVIATTHSSQLVSEDIMDMRGLIRVEKQNGLTKIYQNNIPDTELESAKNIVYFDRPRSDIFFARKVILVEGPTEYRLYNYLKQRGDLPRSLTQNVTVVDTVGKWAMPYFQKILNNYNIRHSVLYDTDGDPNRPDNIAVKSEFSELTDYSYGFPRDIETFCGIQKKGNPAINIIKCFQDGTVSQEKQAEVVGIFKNLIMRKQK
jgi:predicted ATP-dependent endonuclease of OLD family